MSKVSVWDYSFRFEAKNESLKKEVFYKVKNYRYCLITCVLVLFSYIGHTTTYYISAGGNDGNSGTSPEQAWKTLTKVNNFTPRPGDQFLFNRGDSWTGTIIVKASGISGSPVVYGAYGTGDRPKIYGSEEITGWTLHSGKIYKAPFNAEIVQLFMNNERTTLARYPNSGYFNISLVVNSTTFVSTDLNGGINYKGASWVGRTSAYTMFSKTVTGSISKTLVLDSAPTYKLGAGEGFFLCDKFEFLDQAGEWYYDKATKTVYFWSPDGTIPANVRGSVFENGVSISTKDYVVVKDLEILHSAKNGIYVNNSKFITIENNHIISPDLVGIHIPSGNSVAAVLKNNYIFEANGGGIRCFGSSAIITDNTIENTGLHENINKTTYAISDNFGTGIYSRGNTPTISYNRVINSGYAGINWKGRNGNISYNYINGACQVLDDGGGIYTYNGNDYKQPASAGSKVTNNIVLNVFGNRKGYTATYDGGSGIYMDDNIHDVLIENNTVAYTTQGIFLHKNGAITVNNNTVFDAIILHRTLGEVVNNTITSNLYYGTNRYGDLTWWKNTFQRMIYEEASSSVLNHNKYIHPYQKKVFRHSGSDREFPYWKSATKQDANSVFNGTPLAEGETEKLFYNDTKQTKTINLGNEEFRDIDGNKVTKSLTLQPFTSKILIGTNFDVLNNQSPVINDHSFSIQSPQLQNNFIGQVVAYDPDSLQQVYFSIVGGNEANLFSIDPVTGAILANTNIELYTDTTITLIVEVTDNAKTALSSLGNVTINILGSDKQQSIDITPPTIISFVIPSTASSLTIPVMLFEVSDDKAVAGYLLTETSNVPLPDENAWSATAPASYTFGQAGINSLYAWAKDSAGNVAGPAHKLVVISTPDSSDIITGDVVEYVTICEGDTYIDWNTTGEYQRVVSRDSVVLINGENQLKNGDFGGSTDGWSYWGETGYRLTLKQNAVDYVSSPASMQVYCNSNGVSVNALHLITGGEINVEAGKEYELRFYAKATVDFKIARLYVMKGTAPWTMYGNFDASAPKITKEWSEYKIRFTATHTAPDAQLRFYLGNSLPPGQSLFLDDVSLVETGEQTIEFDQVITTNLTVAPVEYATEEITINEGEDYLGWTTEGEYERILKTSAGCDSIVTTFLNVKSPDISVVEDVSICEGENYNGWTTEGEYERILQTASGNDSIVTTYLWVNPVYHITEDITIKEGESYHGWYFSGKYTRNLISEAGCDSIVATNLTVVQGFLKTAGIPGTGDTQSGGVSSSGSLQNPGESAVVNSLLNPAQGMNLNQPTTGLAIEVGDFKLYPNPADTYIKVEYPGFPGQGDYIEILNMRGQVVHTQSVSSTTNTIDVSHLHPGHYILRSNNGKVRMVRKFILD